MIIHPLLHRCCLIAVFVTSAACNLSSITDAAQSQDGELINPDVIESREGARWVYQGAVAKFYSSLGDVVSSSARLTDEVALLPDYVQTEWDIRFSTTPGVSDPYVQGTIAPLQSVKVQLEQAIQLIDRHYGDDGRYMKAHAYGLLGMVYTMVADLYCSGTAFSESMYGGEFNPGAGLPTDSIYLRAVSSADKGIASASDSIPIFNFLKGVKARALNSLGRYEDAANTISDLPDAFTFSQLFSYYGGTAGAGSQISYSPQVILGRSQAVDGYHTLNRKGVNGLIWMSEHGSNQDMRVPIRVDGSGSYIAPARPDFYNGKRPIALFNGAEARLIEAEYHLSSGDINEFIRKINTVRRMYRLRSGAIVPDTSDPGNQEARVDLLFRERAYTFYLMGRRMGDLRRMTRHYGRDPETIWPTGLSEGRDYLVYGPNYVFVPEPQGIGSEAANNPNYNQCESYDP